MADYIDKVNFYNEGGGLQKSVPIKDSDTAASVASLTTKVSTNTNNITSLTKVVDTLSNKTNNFINNTFPAYKQDVAISFADLGGSTSDDGTKNGEILENALTDNITLFIPSGTYKIKGDIHINTRAIITGNGTLTMVDGTIVCSAQCKICDIVLYSNANKPVVEMKEGSEHSEISGVWFDGNHDVSILLNNSFCLISNCVFYKPNRAIVLLGQCINTIITSNYIYAGVVGISIEKDTNNLRAEGILICNNGIFEGTYAISCTNSVLNMNISNCIMDQQTNGASINISGDGVIVDNMQISTTYFGATTNGILIGSTCEKATITACTFNDIKNNCILAVGANGKFNQLSIDQCRMRSGNTCISASDSRQEIVTVNSCTLDSGIYPSIVINQAGSSGFISHSLWTGSLNIANTIVKENNNFSS